MCFIQEKYMLKEQFFMCINIVQAEIVSCVMMK